jgi:hypothetical protein
MTSQVIEGRLSKGGAPPVAAAAADVWPAGAILFALLAGAPPFSRPSDAALPPAPKAVATLLRINTGGRNAVHGQVTAHTPGWQCPGGCQLQVFPESSGRREGNRGCGSLAAQVRA